MPRIAVIVPAAGRSSRFKDKEKKPFVNLDGRAVWLRTVEHFVNRDEVAQTIIVISPDDQEMFKMRFGANLAFMNVQVALGGAERFESVANALKLLKDEVDFVAIHDAVRPFLTEALIASVFAKAFATGAAMLGMPIPDTIKRVDQQEFVTATVPRQGLWLAQTPQVFRRDWLEQAYAERAKLGRDITDDAQLVEAAGHKIAMVDGASTNIKLTTRADLFLGEAILKSMPKPRPAAGGFHPFGEEDMWGGKGIK